jgi:hypothetical protein
VGDHDYGADAAAEANYNALVILGYIPSEQAGHGGLRRCLKSFVAEVWNSSPRPSRFGRPND